jgi:hypothetical protein
VECFDDDVLLRLEALAHAGVESDEVARGLEHLRVCPWCRECFLAYRCARDEFAEAVRDNG